jgi:hypothetical protein
VINLVEDPQPSTPLCVPNTFDDHKLSTHKVDFSLNLFKGNSNCDFHSLTEMGNRVITKCITIEA